MIKEKKFTNFNMENVVYNELKLFEWSVCMVDGKEKKKKKKKKRREEEKRKRRKRGKYILTVL